MVLGKLPVPGRHTILMIVGQGSICAYIRCGLGLFGHFPLSLWEAVKPKRTNQPTLSGSGGAMVLGKLPVPGRPTIWITVGQGPTALAVGAGGGCLDIFTIYPSSPLSPSLCEAARYRLKYCLKRPLGVVGWSEGAG